MKIKPITIIALIVLASLGVYFYSTRDVAKSTISLQNHESQTTDEFSPTRELRQGEQFVESMGLYVTIPEGMSFRQDPVNDRAVNFYIESDPEDEPSYQLYVVYQPNTQVTEEGFEQTKQDMEPQTIQEAVVGGHSGIEGLVVGPKARFYTVVAKDGRPLSFSTIPPTEENKEITKQILSTVSFD
mgnify:CR=1 FL=1